MEVGKVLSYGCEMNGDNQCIESLKLIWHYFG